MKFSYTAKIAPKTIIIVMALLFCFIDPHYQGELSRYSPDLMVFDLESPPTSPKQATVRHSQLLPGVIYPYSPDHLPLTPDISPPGSPTAPTFNDGVNFLKRLFKNHSEAAKPFIENLLKQHCHPFVIDQVGEEFIYKELQSKNGGNISVGEIIRIIKNTPGCRELYRAAVAERFECREKCL